MENYVDPKGFRLSKRSVLWWPPSGVKTVCKPAVLERDKIAGEKKE